ncbi:MAG: PaaI family thioesterase [Oleiphilaceae bacterium]|nr:PaaI family thioesterase [Oleiphilaceae bacterium]
MNLSEKMLAARDTGHYAELLREIPYAATLGMSCEIFGREVVFRLPRNEDNLGNPILPAIHGGVIGGFMEMSASFFLMMTQDKPRFPRIVDFSLDYLRAGLDRETYAECLLTRQGNRVANVTVSAWQKSRQTPIATARAHFIIQ